MGTIRSKLFSRKDKRVDRRLINAMQTQKTRLLPLLCTDQRRILNGNLRLVVNVVVHVVASIRALILLAGWLALVDLRDAERLEEIVAPAILRVVLCQIVGSRSFLVTFLIKLFGHVLHARLVAAAVAKQNDVPEAVRLVAPADVCQQRLERLFLEADRTRVVHVSAGAWLDLAFRNDA